MARARIRFRNGAIRALMNDAAVVADLEARAKRVAAEANAESSWGGYYSAVSTEGNRPRGRVWNIKQGASDDEARNNRMIRALDAGR